MSNRALNAVWDHADADGSDLVVLLSLADQANDDGYCWPGVESLMRRARRSERAVQRTLKRLADAGQIVIEERPGTTSIYWLTPLLEKAQTPGVDDGGNDPDEATVENGTPGVDDGGSDASTPGTDATPGADDGGATDAGGVPASTTGDPRRPRHPNPQEPSRTPRDAADPGGASPDEQPTDHEQLVAALAEACYPDATITKPTWGAIARAAADLNEVGATPDQVTAAAGRYRREWPKVDLTPNALAKHWPRFATTADTDADPHDGAVTYARNFAGLPWDDVESMLLSAGYDGDAIDAAREAWDLEQGGAAA